MFKNAYRRWGKRAFDLLFTVLALIPLLPVIGILYIIVRSGLGSPVLFRQQRPGLAGRPFLLFKFRTMTDARDAKGDLLPDSERLTRLGLFLRKTSLDELPTLFNVLNGDMSLVGPRPLLMGYLALYTPEQMRRHDVMPGMTGWAQINGRNAISWEKKFALDLWYVEHQSFRLDMKILLRTLRTVIQREGINQAGVATMPEFMGTRGQQNLGQPVLNLTNSGQ